MQPPIGALAEAEACRSRGDIAAGRAAAERAWAEAHGGGAADHIGGRTDDATRARAGWLRAFFTYRSGDLAGLLTLADGLTPLLRAQGGAEFGEYLRWVTLAACDLGRFGVALPHAYEAHAAAQVGGSPAQLALALNAFGACFERMGDPWQAERLMTEALPLAREHGSAYDTFVTLNNLCAVLIGAYYLLRGEATQDEARAALQRALPFAREALQLMPALSERFASVFARGNLGEVLIHLGEAGEGVALVETALAEARAAGFGPQVQRMRCTLAEWRLQQDQPAPALADMDRLFAEGLVSPTTAVRAHQVAYEAARRLGDTARALRHLEQKAELERRRAVQQLRAQSEQFITRFEAEQSRRDAERERARAQALEADVRRDPLTGLGNRREVALRLPALLAQAAHERASLALVMLDLDAFKQVNDRFGHAAGDQVLVELAHMLREKTRAGDLLARVGGEEFMVVLPDIPPGRAAEVCERLRATVQGHDWGALAPGLAVTLSLGMAVAPPYDETALTARADAALYRAKTGGRNRVVRDRGD